MIERNKRHGLIADLIAYLELPADERDVSDLRHIGEELFVEGGEPLLGRAYMLAVAYSFGDYTMLRDVEKTWRGIGGWQ